MIFLWVLADAFTQIAPRSVGIGAGGYAAYDGGKQSFYDYAAWGGYTNLQYMLSHHFSLGLNYELSRAYTQKDFQLPDSLFWTRITERQKARRFALFTRYYHEIGSPKWQVFLQGSVLFYNQYGVAVRKDNKEFVYPLSGIIEIGLDVIPGIQFMPSPKWGIEATAGRLYVVSGLKGLNSYDHQGFTFQGAKIGVNYYLH